MNRRSFVALAAAVLTSPLLPRWLGRRDREDYVWTAVGDSRVRPDHALKGGWSEATSEQVLNDINDSIDEIRGVDAIGLQWQGPFGEEGTLVRMPEETDVEFRARVIECRDRMPAFIHVVKFETGLRS